ncbi:MAG: hypothetical protein A4S12_13385 [Proteobacteria bacterium SG_bin5]|nr:glycosyltransferase family 39 protein [Sphingomonas sp.]OQW44739.1 MAG: hypothetical protein A4S12_13385 [Proteobacteria bacterium SG_bin5]
MPLASRYISRFAPPLLTVQLAGIAVAAAAVEAVALYRAPFWGVLGCGAWLALLAIIVAPERLGVRPRHAVPLAIAAALALRCVSTYFVSGVALGADPMNYSNLAHAVLDGRGLVTDDWRYGQNLRAYFPPLYPLLLAGWWALFGASLWATLALTTLTDALAAWLLAGLGRRFAGAAGARAGLLYFAYPSFALAGAIPHKEGLTLLLGIALLRVAVAWRDAPRDTLAALAGVLWGLLALTQPSLALAPLALALVLIGERGWWRTVRLGLVVAPALVLVMSPWWLRNWLIFDRFVPFTTASGFMTNVALGRLGLPIDPALFQLSEPDRADVMGRAALARIAEQPFGFLRESGWSVLSGLAYEEATLARYRHTSPPIAPALHAPLTAILQGAYLTLLVPAALAARRASPLLAGWTLALLIAIAGIGLWFEFGERHRYLVTPLVMILAVQALAATLSGRSSPNTR